MRDMHRIKRRRKIIFEPKQFRMLMTITLILGVVVFVSGIFVGRNLERKNYLRVTKQAPSQQELEIEENIIEEQDVQPSADVYENLTAHAQPIDPLLLEDTDPEQVKQSKREPRMHGSKKHASPQKKLPAPYESRKNKKKPRKTAQVSVPAFPTGEYSEEIIPPGNYTVQIGAFRKLSEARTFAQAIKDKRKPVRIVKASLGEQGTWYRIRIGNFESELKANLYRVSLRNEDIQSWVVQAE